MTYPRWANDIPPEIDQGLSSKVVESADHAGKMFKTSTFCGGQIELKEYAGLRANDISNRRTHYIEKD